MHRIAGLFHGGTVGEYFAIRDTFFRDNFYASCVPVYARLRGVAQSVDREKNFRCFSDRFGQFAKISPREINLLYDIVMNREEERHGGENVQLLPLS